MPLPPRRWWWWLLGLGAITVRCLVAAAPEAYDVGETRREFVDPTRPNWLGTGPRPLRTIVWYPTTPDVPAEREAGNDEVRKEAPLVHGPDRHPLVLVSHGSGGDAGQMRWLGIALARRGFIAAAVTHNGTDEEELGGKLSATDFFAWERPRDLSVVLDALLADHVLGPKIDRERIGAAGFSLGATSVLWLGGARLDLELLRTQSPPPPPFLRETIDELIAYSTATDIGRAAITRASQSYRDERIRGIFALAPAMGPGFPADGLRAMDVPVFIVVGDADVITPPDDNAARFARYIPDARLTVLAGERGHYTRGTPAEQQATDFAEVSAMAVDFFRETLGSTSPQK